MQLIQSPAVGKIYCCWLSEERIRAVFPELDRPRKAIGTASSIQINYLMNRPIKQQSFLIRKQQMELVKGLEETVFAKIVHLQKIRVQSELAFLLASLLRFVFKDAFVLIFFLMPINTITRGIASHVIVNSAAISTSLLAFVVILYVLYIYGSKWGQSVQDFSRLFLPFADVTTFSTVTLSLVIVSSTTNIVLIACGVLTVIGISFFSICYNMFNFSKSPKSINIFQFKQAKTVMFSYLLQLVFCYYLAISWSINFPFGIQQLIFYCSIKFIITAMKFRQKLIQKFYINMFAQKVSSFFYFMEFNLACIVQSISILQIGSIETNAIYILIVMTTLGYISLKVYLQRRDSQLYLSSAKDLKDEDQGLIYLDCLAELFRKVQNQEQDIILISLKTKHKLGCAQNECFCKRPEKNLKQFIEDYIKCQLQIMTKFFHDQINVLLSVLYFKMVLFKFYPQIFSKLAEYQTKFNFSITQRFYKYSLTSYVSTYISRKNFQIDAVQSQQMFKLQEFISQLQKLIYSEVEIREKMWKYLSRGLCQVGQIEILCGKQLSSIKRVMQIYNQNRLKFKKSKQFNLLILFYFTKISFLNNGSQIKANLKEIYYGYKVDELHSIKQFKKFIYHKLSCSIQTHIDPKAMGIITAASHNVEEMFGFPYASVIGSSINSLMPQFMAGEHQIIIDQWAKTGTWRTIGKLKEIYCIHKEQYCFSALLYLKIYAKETGLHFITNIFKLNDSDYLVANADGRIEGIGKKFLKVFGQAAKKMPLGLLIEQKMKKFQLEEFEENKICRQVFMSLKGAEKQVQEYFQSSNNRVCDKSRFEINQAFYNRLTESCSEKFFIEFTTKKYKMGSLHFWVLQMMDTRAIEHNKISYFLDHTSKYICSIRQHLGNQLDFDISQQKSQDSLEEDDEQDFFNNNCNSSMASLSEKENYPLSKVIQKFLQILQKPQTINDSRIKNITYGIIFFITILSLVNFFSYLIYWAALTQIQNIFFADGAVSDIMQTTEIAYDHINNLKAQLLSKNFSSFDSQLKSAQYLQSYVYGLNQYSFAHLITDKTNFLKKRIYSYIQDSVDWRMDNTLLQVQAYQFLENMYYITGELIHQLQILRKSNITKLNFSDPTQFNAKYFQMLLDNFPAMKKMNQYYLQNYQQKSNDSHQMLNTASILSMIIHFIITLGGAIFLDRYFRFRFAQVQTCFQFYGLIPHSYLEKLRDYYNQVSSTIIDENQLKNIDNQENKIFPIDTQDLFFKAQGQKASIKSKLKLINYANYYHWLFILLAFFCLNGINYMSTTNIRSFFGPSQKIIELVNELMRSQNRLLQTYFELKASYYIDPTNQFKEKYFIDLKKHLNTTVSTFSVIANQITALLSPYDSAFQAQFTNALIINVCKLSAQFLPQSENTKCKKQLKLNILDGGIMIAMNYFQVSVQGAMQYMRTQYVLKSVRLSNANFFNAQTYTQLDKMLIYMFKLYQLTQSICYNSYTNAISQISSIVLIYCVAFSFFYGLILTFWTMNISGQKQKLSFLYGQLLLVPFNILKSNNRIVSFLKEAVQYSEV